MKEFETETPEHSEVSPELNRLTHEVIGAAIAVHSELGPGYHEKTYEAALCIELDSRRIPFRRQHPVTVFYRGCPVGDGFLDLLVDDRLVVELKAIDALLPVHKAQVLSYLKATGLTPGLLINFHTPILTNGVKRIIRSSV